MPEFIPDIQRLTQIFSQATAPTFFLGAVAAFVSLMSSRLSTVIARIRVLNGIPGEDPTRVHLKDDVDRLRRRARLLSSRIYASIASGICATVLLAIVFASEFIRLKYAYGAGLLFIFATLFLGVGLLRFAPIADGARADESGASFWQPGTYDSLAASPNQPGWSLSTTPYHSAGYAGSNVSAAQLVRVGLLNQTQAGNLAATSANFENIVTIAPSYGFNVPNLGAQAAISVSTVVGHSSVSETGTLTANLGSTGIAKPFGVGDSVTGFGDLSPQATLYWSRDVHNFMVYATGNASVGAYKQTRLANLGLGHGAVDAGGGYTYLNHDAGLAFSAVAGFTYNLTNTFTNYQSGVDFHLDTGASKYLNDSLIVGPVGYFYDEIGCDSGSGDRFGCFRSRVAGLGAQGGYSFALENALGYLNLRGYGEFAAENRPAGWNARLAFSLSPK